MSDQFNGITNTTAFMFFATIKFLLSGDQLPLAMLSYLVMVSSAITVKQMGGGQGYQLVLI